MAIAASLTKPMKLEEFVISGRDAPELFQLIEEALDETAFFVDHNLAHGMIFALHAQPDKIGLKSWSTKRLQKHGVIKPSTRSASSAP